MNAIRLYTGPLSMFGAKAEIALLEKGLDFERIAVPFVDRYEPKHPEVVRINPKQQVPVLIHGSVEIFDSTQIFEYLEEKGLVMVDDHRSGIIRITAAGVDEVEAQA